MNSEQSPWKIQLFKLNYDHRELEAVESVIHSRWLTMGEKTQQFESNFSEFIGNDIFSIAVSSGTAALHLALLALEIGNDDEVIIPALTFVADANVVRMVGARPVIADSHSQDNWNVSLATIKACATDKTKAIIVVHYAGYPCEIGPISEFCKENNIFLIEDVAHAPGAEFAGKKCGTFGDISCFSFFTNKNISIGEGGMVCTMSQKLAERIGFLRSHGMTTLTLDRHRGRAQTYDVAMPGLNYRMDEMRAAIGLVQLSKLESSNNARGLLTDYYRKVFSNTGITIPFSKMNFEFKSAFHILPILLPNHTDRSTVMSSLKSFGVQSSIHYPPFWAFSAYKNYLKKEFSPVVENICNNQLTLPLYPDMSESDVDYVASALLHSVG